MKLINKLLNIYIFFIIIYFLYIIFVNLVEPYIYKSDSSGRDVKNYSNIAYINGALENYMDYYFKGNIEAIKACTVKNVVKSDEAYNNIIKYLSDNKLNNIKIKNIQKRFGDVYIITFYINSEDNYCSQNNLYKCIFKLNMSNSTFKIYYDSLVDKGEK